MLHIVWFSTVCSLVLLAFISRDSHWAAELLSGFVSSIGWPVVTVWGLVYFREEIVAIAKRVTKFGGVELADPQRSTLPPATEEGLGAATSSGIISPEIIQIGATELARNAAQGALPRSEGASTSAEQSYFTAQPEQVPNKTVSERIFLLHRNYGANARLSRLESERDLIHQLAVTLTSSEFREISLVIYGSQMKLLRRLRYQDANDSDLAMFMKIDRDESWPALTIEDWIGWLINKQLILRESTGLVSLTQKGRDFADWDVRLALRLDTRAN